VVDRLEPLKQIVFDAGEILKKGFHSKKRVEYKGVVDLVTQYDKECEKFILDRVSDIFTDFTVMAEESYNNKSVESVEKVIYIDPIDGTTNFVHQIPHFAISVGVYINGRGKIAIVYNPILEEMFWAIDGEGAYKNSSRIEVSKQESLQKSLIATGFPYAKVEKGREYEWSVKNISNILPYIQDIRRLGQHL